MATLFAPFSGDRRLCPARTRGSSGRGPCPRTACRSSDRGQGSGRARRPRLGPEAVACHPLHRRAGPLSAGHGDFVVWVVGMGHEELTWDATATGSFRTSVCHWTSPSHWSARRRVPRDRLVPAARRGSGRDPGVGLFGPTRADTWGFRFAPHRHIDRRVTADITVEEVLMRWKILWSAMSERWR